MITTLCLLSISCSSDNHEETEALTLSGKNVVFSSEGGMQEVVVTANTKWEAISDASWLSVETTGSNGIGTIRIMAENNSSIVEKSAKVLVTTLSGCIYQEIIVSQEGAIIEQEPIVGTWKLMQADFYGLLVHEAYGVWPPFLDFSESDVFFEFTTDGVLIVSGEMENLDDWFLAQGVLQSVLEDQYSLFRIDEGVYAYTVEKQPSAPGEYEGYTFLIDEELRYTASFHDDEMSIGKGQGIGSYRLKVK